MIKEAYLPHFYDYQSQENTSSKNMKTIVLIVIYILILVLPNIMAYAIHPTTKHLFLRELGKSLGLLVVPILFLQVFLAARLQFIDRYFGLDRLMQFHRIMGTFALIIIL